MIAMIIRTLIFILFFFFRIARDDRHNEIKKQWANADQEKKLKRMIKSLGNNIPSESESENAITFTSIDILCSICLSFLQSRRDYLKSKILSWSNSQNHNQLCNQERIQKIN